MKVDDLVEIYLKEHVISGKVLSLEPLILMDKNYKIIIYKKEDISFVKINCQPKSETIADKIKEKIEEKEKIRSEELTDIKQKSQVTPTIGNYGLPRFLKK
jgi:predicted transport protein